MAHDPDEQRSVAVLSVWHHHRHRVFPPHFSRCHASGIGPRQGGLRPALRGLPRRGRRRQRAGRRLALPQAAQLQRRAIQDSIHAVGLAALGRGPLSQRHARPGRQFDARIQLPVRTGTTGSGEPCQIPHRGGGERSAGEQVRAGESQWHVGQAHHRARRTAIDLRLHHQRPGTLRETPVRHLPWRERRG